MKSLQISPTSEKFKALFDDDVTDEALQGLQTHLDGMFAKIRGNGKDDGEKAAKKAAIELLRPILEGIDIEDDLEKIVTEGIPALLANKTKIDGKVIANHPEFSKLLDSATEKLRKDYEKKISDATGKLKSYEKKESMAKVIPVIEGVLKQGNYLYTPQLLQDLLSLHPDYDFRVTDGGSPILMKDGKPLTNDTTGQPISFDDWVSDAVLSRLPKDTSSGRTSPPAGTPPAATKVDKESLRKEYATADDGRKSQIAEIIRNMPD